MGCFDTVIVPCPECGELEYFQSKSGECLLRNYKLEDCPKDVLLDVNRHAPYTCRKCRTQFAVSLDDLDNPVVMKLTWAKASPAKQCECVSWADVHPCIRFLTGHHENCSKRGNLMDAAKRLLADLVHGIERWGAEEDGVYPEVWEAYKKAKCVLGEFDWREDDRDQRTTASQVPPCQ